MNWPQIEEITYSECDNPHKLLGPHKQGSKMLVQAYFPGAEKVTIHWKKTGQVGEAFLTDVPMELADEEGYFAALVNAGKMSPYEYVVEYGKTKEHAAYRKICGDAYRHVPQITKEDMDRFPQAFIIQSMKSWEHIPWNWMGTREPILLSGRRMSCVSA